MVYATGHNHTVEHDPFIASQQPHTLDLKTFCVSNLVRVHSKFGGNKTFEVHCLEHCSTRDQQVVPREIGRPTQYRAFPDAAKQIERQTQVSSGTSNFAHDTLNPKT